jgi:hypothetical protein
MNEQSLAEMEAELESLHGTVGRLIASDSHHRRSTKKHYEAQRRLENAIRKHASGACGCRNFRQCMIQLAKIVPMNPRPKYGARKKVKVSK